jgi:hypothetical protein
MVNFDFYRISGQWRLTVSEGDCLLSTICFSDDVDYTDIVNIVPILAKGDISGITVNFTEEKNNG